MNDSFFLAGPRIVKFEFPLDLQVGQRTSVPCLVSSGSPPYKFEWIKDGLVISSNERTSIGEFEGVSTLVIKETSIEDAGNYTCIAKNAFGSDSFTAKLTLKGKMYHIPMYSVFQLILYQIPY